MKHDFCDFFKKKHRRCVKNGLSLKKQLFNKMSQHILKLALPDTGAEKAK